MNFPWVIFGLLTLARLFFASFGHLGETESYLLLCSRHLDWGFVEGPAGVPALMWLSQVLLGQSLLMIRWFSPMLLLGVSWILWYWIAAVRNQKTAFWTVMIFNLLPLSNAAGVVMDGTMVLTVCWIAALWAGWRLVTSRVAKNKISAWVVFGGILAVGIQVTYQIGCLFPLVIFASLSCFQNEVPAQNKEMIFSSRGKKFLGIVAATLILSASWLPIFWWNQNHEWLQFQNMTWDSFWSWPPSEAGYFQHLPLTWFLLVLTPLLIAGSCCFSGIWNIEEPFFLIVAIPLFFCINELGHGKVPFALLLVLTALFLPIAVEFFIQRKKRAIVGLLLLLPLGCSSFLLLFGKISSSTTQESSWNFPSTMGIMGIETVANELMKLRATYIGVLTAPAVGDIEQEGDGASRRIDGTCMQRGSHWLDCQKQPQRDEPHGSGQVATQAASADATQVYASAVGLCKNSADTPERPPFLIAETPGLAAVLGAVLPIEYPERPGAPAVFIPESPALTSQFQLWPHYADATTENRMPDPLYTEEKAVSPFLGHDAFYITTETWEEIPQTITGAFAAIIPLNVTFHLTKNSRSEELNIYLCQHYQMLSL